MDTKILRSIASLALVVALGVGATYAAVWTSNEVTIASNAMAAGSAAIKLCKQTPGANAWQTSVNPGLTISDLVPGAEGAELNNNTIYLGNDNGDLETSVGTDICDSYNSTEGSSDVTLQMVPKVTLNTETCAANLSEHLELAVVLGTGTSAPVDTDYKSLDDWVINTDPVGSEITPGNAEEVRMFGRLSADAPNDVQGGNCVFGLNFIGEHEVIVDTTPAP